MPMQRLLGLGGRRANAVVGAAALVVTAALIVLGVSLHATQTHARETVRSRFQDRAQVVSALIQAEVSSVPSSAAATPAYTSPTVNGAALDKATAQSHLAFAAILDRAGTVVARSHTTAATDLSQALRSPAFARVRAGAPVSLSDVLSGGDRAPDVGSTSSYPCRPTRALASSWPACRPRCSASCSAPICSGSRIPSAPPTSWTATARSSPMPLPRPPRPARWRHGCPHSGRPRDRTARTATAATSSRRPSPVARGAWC